MKQIRDVNCGKEDINLLFINALTLHPDSLNQKEEAGN